MRIERKREREGERERERGRKQGAESGSSIYNAVMELGDGVNMQRSLPHIRTVK